MRFLLVDTADARGSLAFYEAGSLRMEAHPEAEEYSSWLLPAVRRLLAEAGVTLSGLDAYAVCAGPGSFTGLRVGLATVKAWAEIHEKPIVPVSRLEALTETLPGEPLPGEPLLGAFLDARRGQVFAALYGAALHESRDGLWRLSGPEAVLPLERCLREAEVQAAGRRVCWRTPDPGLLQALPDWARLSRAGHRLEAVEAPLTARLALLAERKLRAGEVTDAVALDANYVRRSDAELHWKESASEAGS